MVSMCECGHMHVAACTGRQHTEQVSEVDALLPLWVLGIKLRSPALEGKFTSGLRNGLPSL